MAQGVLNRSWKDVTVLSLVCVACLVMCVHSSSVYRSMKDDDLDGVRPVRDESEACQQCAETRDPMDCEVCRQSLIVFAKRNSFPTAARRTSSCACCLHSRSTNEYCCSTCYKKRSYYP